MATKKITELPFINTLSGSSVFDNPTQNTVVPVVLYGTTNQITVENFSKFTNLYAAQTGSQNIFTQNQWFNATVSASTINVGTLGVGGNTTIAGTLGVSGNGTIGGNLAVAGRITAEEFYTEITTASVIYASGSTKFGDDTGDTHEFTGSINVSGSVIYNGVILSNIDANTIERLQQTTQSLQVATASLQAFSSSVNDQLQRVYQTTQSLHVATASLQFHSASVDSQLLAIQQTTQSLQVATASLNAFTASQDGRNFIISQYTSSTDAHIVGISAFTSSQLAVNLGNAIYTASVDSHIVGISTYTSSVRDTLARVHQSTQSLQVATASLQQFTASQDDRNFVVSQVTGSLIGITNGLMAFTAALDNTYATDAQLYQLYQATRSIELTTGSLIGITNGLMAFTAALDSTYATDAQLYQLYQSTRSLELHSGSMIGVTNGLMAYTASNETWKDGVRGEISGIEAWTASLDSLYATDAQLFQLYQATRSIELTTGSLIGITNGLMAFTASLDNTFATDVQLLPILQATRSLELLSGSLIGITNGLMAFTAALDSTYATDAQLYQLYQATQSLELHSGSMIGITNGLMAFTAALDSTYATDAQLYQLYAETASIKAEIAGIEAYTASLKGAIEVSGQDVNVLGMITAQQFNVTYVSSSVMYRSGSTEFGDSSDDRHLFTGSLIVSGTLVAGTDENGWGRISFNESTNTLRIQSSKNGTQCTPISFWSQRDGGTFAESMAISGSYVSINRLAASANYKLGVSGSAYINGANDKGIFVTDNATFASIVGLNSAISAYNPLELRASGTDYQLYLPTTGEVLMGSNSVGAQNSGAITFRTTTAAYGGVIIMNHSTTNNTGAGYLDCYYNTSYIGGIQQNGASNVAFNTSSDYRLKEDLKDFNGLNLISNLKVYDFKWKTDNTRMYGVLAHELQEIIPYVVNGNKDEVKEDGKIKVQVVDYSKIVPILIKSIQEQQDIIEELKARIEALENK